MIQEIPISQLGRQIKQLEAAEAAVQTDLNYHWKFFREFLNNSGCLELRKLRDLQIKKVQGSTKGLNNLIGKVTAVPFMFGGKGDKDPEGL